VKRVVVRAPNWLGDAVMALPAIAGVGRGLADGTLAIAAPRPLAPLFEMVEGVDEVVGFDGLTSEIRALGSGRFDIGLLLPNSFRSALAMRRAGVIERWGYAADLRGWLLTRRVRRPGRRTASERHHSRYYLMLIAALGFDPSAPLPRLAVPAAARVRADALLAAAGIPADRPLVGLAPGAAYGSAKRWPPQHFAELVVGLQGNAGPACVLLGTTGDRATAREIESSVARLRGPQRREGASPPADLTGRTDLQTLAGVIARCRAFVSNDSGAMHLAGALGVPVAAIFGPTDEHATAPLGPHDLVVEPVWCRPCLLRECPIDHRCMTRISPARVGDAVAARLAAGTPR
jgi:heptosyltransferase-2